ncbi:MAG: nucleoside deaminase [bacterium]|nr:nucleoside deaminase [bacterium]
MRLALAEAERAFESGETPVGTTVIREGEVIGRGFNEVEATGNPAAHAEMIALRKAAEHLGEKYLYGCTLYVTLEPCPMCAFAVMLYRVKTIVFGASDPKFGGCGSVLNIPAENAFNHRPEVVGGILEEECAALMRRFFEDKR